MSNREPYLKDREPTTPAPDPNADDTPAHITPREDNRLTEKDELILTQLKPYMVAAATMLALSLFSVFWMGFKPELTVFWLSIAVVVINASFLIYLYLRVRKMRR